MFTGLKPKPMKDAILLESWESVPMLSIIAPLRDMFIKRTEQSRDSTQTVTAIVTLDNVRNRSAIE